MDDGLGLIGDDGSGPAGSAAARGRRKAKAKAHAFEIVRPWPSLQRRCDPGGKPARSGTLATHCSLLLTSLLEHLHAREHHEAMATLALLMREFSRLAGTVAQAGLLLLRLSHGAELPERRVLFLRRVARFDTVHRHALLMELALEEARRGQHEAASQVLLAELSDRRKKRRQPEEAPADTAAETGTETEGEAAEEAAEGSGRDERRQRALLHGFAGLALHGVVRAKLPVAAAATPAGGWMAFELPPAGWSARGEQPLAAAAAASGDGGGGSGGGGGGSTLAAAADAEEGGGEEGGGAAPSGDVGSAARHLARARRELPDSTLYAACEAQLLSHAGRLDQAHAVLLDAADAGVAASASAARPHFLRGGFWL
mmetsp:Transcript_34382/g.109820  ORF Transcript_34382/g.109820 Transcript_34382/m.109820 type:complete len:371 (-) Transcript_34382:441-1553(-)